MSEDRPAQPGPASIADALCAAYRAGVFPMAVPGGVSGKGQRGGAGEDAGEIWWFDPDPRGVIPLEAPWDPPPRIPGLGGLRAARSLRQRLRSGRFRVTCDTAFGRVIRRCAAPRRGQDPDAGHWIDERIVKWYESLHAAGHAHSVEAWLGEGPDARLVGGLYGVAVGGLFAGESMFSDAERGGTDASKVCLVHLMAHLIGRGFLLLDTQFGTEHLARLGGVEIARERYHERLARANAIDPGWGEFIPTRAVDALERAAAGASEPARDSGGGPASRGARRL